MVAQNVLLAAEGLREEEDGAAEEDQDEERGRWGKGGKERFGGGGGGKVWKAGEGGRQSAGSSWKSSREPGMVRRKGC